MNASQARRIIEEHVAGIYANVQVSWPNAPFDPPENTYWVKSDIIWGDGFMWTKDGRVEGLNLVVGVLQLAYYQPRDTGDGDLYDLVQLARPFLNRKRLFAGDDPLQFTASSGPRVSFEESWRVLTMSTPFSFVETVTL